MLQLAQQMRHFRNPGVRSTAGLAETGSLKKAEKTQIYLLIYLDKLIFVTFTDGHI